jgi:hypothetical protein
MKRSRLWTVGGWVLLVAAAFSLAACSGGSAPSTLSAQSEAARPTGPAYSTKYFTTPLDLSVPSWLGPIPAEDTAHFVTFTSAHDSRSVRILSPVVLYPPGSTTETPIPKDYIGYLLTQTDHGGHLTDRIETTVDGHPATVVTARTDKPLDGSIGCPDTGIRPSDCFGLQPDLILRLAVVRTDHGPLLIWLRNQESANPDMATETQKFTELLSGVHFSARSPQAAPAPAATQLDGTYTWTITERDARKYGTASDRTSQGLARFPITFTVVLDTGNWTMQETSSSETGSGTYEITGDKLTFHWGGTTLAFSVKEGDGTLHLRGVAPMDLGDRFIWTTEPWVKR